MKKILSLFLCLILVMSFSSTVFAANFTDTNGHKNEVAIDTLSTIGVIEGYGNGVFGPDDSLTRAQLCTMLVRALYSDDLHYDNVNRFEDVKLSHWARIYIDTAYRYGLMIGHGNNTFGPDDNLTYTQTARTILNILGYGALAWPNGVNLVALELGLYKGITIIDYETDCTRAHAAQMIYNAFDLELVKEYAGIPMRTDKTFLVDKLGYAEVEVFKNGHIYVGYKNLRTNEVVATDIVLTTEARIYSTAEGTKYYFEDNYKKSYTIDWENVQLYVNNVLIEEDIIEWFATADLAVGIFNTNNELVSIYMLNRGVTCIPALDFNMDAIPEEALERAKKSAEYDFELSTITYYAESDTVVVTTNPVIGFITDVTTTRLTINNIRYSVENARDYSEGQYVIIYRDASGMTVGAPRVIDEPYRYNLKTVKYHTWECHYYNEKIDIEDWITTLDDLYKYILEEELAGDTITFDACRSCLASKKLAVKIYTSVEGWDYYHTSKCDYIQDTSKELIVVDPMDTTLTKHSCCD